MSLRLSRAKATYLLDLAGQQANELIDIEHMNDLSDVKVIATLAAVYGIGLWSAQISLLHQTGHLPRRRIVGSEPGCEPAMGLTAHKRS